VIQPVRFCSLLGIALLSVGSAVPVIASAHSEGVEAADPNTPPAVLTFDAAARRYTPLRRARADWQTRFADAPISGAGGHANHMGHGGATQATSSQPQQ